MVDQIVTFNFNRIYAIKITSSSTSSSSSPRKHILWLFFSFLQNFLSRPKFSVYIENFEMYLFYWVTWTGIDIFNLFWQHVNAKFIEWTAVTMILVSQHEWMHLCTYLRHITTFSQAKQKKNDFELVDWI